MLGNNKLRTLFILMFLLSAPSLPAMQPQIKTGQTAHWQGSGSYTITAQTQPEEIALCRRQLSSIGLIFSEIQSWQFMIDEIARLGQARGATDFHHSQERCRAELLFGGESDEARWAQQDRDAHYQGYNQLIIQTKLRNQPLILTTIANLTENLNNLQEHIPQFSTILKLGEHAIREQLRNFQHYLLREKQRTEQNIRNNQDSRYELRSTNICCPSPPCENVRDGLLFSLHIIQNKLEKQVKHNEKIIEEGTFQTEGTFSSNFLDPLSDDAELISHPKTPTWEKNLAYTKEYCRVVLWNRLSKPALKGLWTLSCWAARKGIELTKSGIAVSLAELKQCIGRRKQHQTKTRYPLVHPPLCLPAVVSNSQAISDDEAS